MMKKSLVWRLMVAATVVLTLVALAGCGGGNDSSSNKKTLIYATMSDATRLDPQNMTDVPSYNPMHMKVYETLYAVDQNGEIQPLLATDVKIVDDLTWEFKLREGVKFHDGTPFNAEAVKKSFDSLMDPNDKKAYGHILKGVKEVQVVDENTVRIITEAPFPALRQHLSHTATAIISPKALEEKASKSLDQNPVGTGPFKLENWTKGESLTLIANAEYWGKKPTLEKIVFKVVPEDSTRVAMVQTGEAHIADKIPFVDVKRYDSDPKFTVVRTTSFATDFLGLNMKNPKFQDIRVRKAIDLGIDRKAILDGVFYGVGELNVSTLSPKVFGFNPNLPPAEYNPEKAKALLKEAGVENLHIVLWTSTNNKARLKVAEVVQAQLKEIGVTVELKTLEWGTFLQAHHDGETEMYIVGWSNSSGDAGAGLINWTEAGFGNSNGSYYTNSEVEALMVQAASEMDVEKRKELYWKVQEITSQASVRFVLRSAQYVSLTGKNVKNVVYNPTEILLPENIVIE